MKEHVCIVHTSIVVPPFKWSFCSVSASNCLNLNITYTVNGLFAGFAFPKYANWQSCLFFYIQIKTVAMQKKSRKWWM